MCHDPFSDRSGISAVFEDTSGDFVFGKELSVDVFVDFGISSDSRFNAHESIAPFILLSLSVLSKINGCGTAAISPVSVCRLTLRSIRLV